ncbi:hypothetical protein HK096_000184 [Nowakowskiella sp. JEL0078]|nr:hypothetical protein HK096_000184 [Nowakowskiella sp. JEL0078]
MARPNVSVVACVVWTNPFTDNVKGNFRIRDPLLTSKGVCQASTLPEELARDPAVAALVRPLSRQSGDASELQLPVQLVLVSPMRRTIQTSAFIFSDSLCFAANSASRELYSDSRNSTNRGSAKTPRSLKRSAKSANKLKSSVQRSEFSAESSKAHIPNFNPDTRRTATIPAYLVPDLQEVSNFNCDTGLPFSHLLNEFPFLTNPVFSKNSIESPLLAEEWYTAGKRKSDFLLKNLSERVKRVKKLIWESEAQSVFIVSHGGFLASFVDGPWGMVAGWFGLGNRKWKNTEVRFYRLFEDGSVELAHPEGLILKGLDKNL